MKLLVLGWYFQKLSSKASLEAALRGRMKERQDKLPLNFFLNRFSLHINFVKCKVFYFA